MIKTFKFLRCFKESSSTPQCGEMSSLQEGSCCDTACFINALLVLREGGGNGRESE